MKNVNIFNESSAITMYYGFKHYDKLFSKSNYDNDINSKYILFIDAGHSKTSFILSQYKFNEFKVELVECLIDFGGRTFDNLIFISIPFIENEI